MKTLPAAIVVAQTFESPLGYIRAAANNEGIRQLEFIDIVDEPRTVLQPSDEASPAQEPAAQHHLESLRSELTAYFAGTLRAFTTPLAPSGTPFQHRVWSELRTIPHGETISYATLANRLADPNATRAVARANAQNRIAILIPCHRVIGKDGTLTGYAGGLDRKRALLELEGVHTLFSGS